MPTVLDGVTPLVTNEGKCQERAQDATDAIGWQHIADTSVRGSDNRWAVLALLGVVQLMVVLEATVMNIAMRSAQRRFIPRPMGGRYLKLVADGQGSRG